jgi:PAS domain S-box-containing protein
LSFRLKIILGIALIESVLLLLLVLSSLNFLRSSNEEQLLQRASTTSKLFASATTNAVLATDLAALDSFVEEILTNPEVVYVRILADHQVLAEGSGSGALPEHPIPDADFDSVDDAVFDVRVPIQIAGTVYGAVELGLSIQSIQGVLSEARDWATGIAVTEVLLVAVFSFILGTYLSRQLQRLRVASRTVTQAGPGHQLEVSGQDEIADVARAFNAMSSSLQRSYSELQDSLESQRQMVDSLERNRRKNHAILASSLDAIVTIDKAGRVVDYSDAAERIFGWSSAEMVGRNMADHLVPPDLREAHNNGMDHFHATGEGPVLGKRIQLEAMHKDGRRFPIEIAIAPIETPDGPLFTAFVRDISHQIANQTELRLAATAFDAIEPMFITDADARIIRVNRAFLENTGYTEGEILGNTPSLWSSGQHDKAFYKSLWGSLKQRGKWTGEIYNRRKNGNIHPDYLSISAVYDQEGAITHFVAHMLDITFQKTKERELRLASMKARQADEAKSRFLAVMSHEIRTPMNAVLGIFELLNDSPLDDNQQELIRTGRESSELLLSIINDILDFSKMDADKLKLEQVPFDLHQVLSQSTELLRNQAHQKDLSMILQIDDHLPRYAKGDPVRLRQILINLINNAVKFTEKGGVQIRTRVENNQGQTFRMYCEVQDTGIGIPRALQQNLFEEFSMVDQSHSRSTGGTGLGLAISKRLVQLMGGDIGIESLPNVGSVFRFHIELQGANPSEIAQSIGLASLAIHTTDIRILLAEDNSANRRVIEAMLKKSGLSVDIVPDGYAALQAVSVKPYDLVLMDISMPRMDGIAATRAIRHLVGPPAQTPIVAITAHTLSGDRDRFLSAGMNDYLSKPINKGALLACIKRWVKETSADPSDAIPTEPPFSATTAPPAASEAAALHTPQPPSPRDSENEDVVDEAVLRQLVRDTSADLVPELLQGYIEDAKERLQQIEQALEEEDTQRLEAEAHTLGSSAGAHGNKALHRLARQIETLCRTDKCREAMEKTPELVTLARHSLERLAQRLQRDFDNV